MAFRIFRKWKSHGADVGDAFSGFRSRTHPEASSKNPCEPVRDGILKKSKCPSRMKTNRMWWRHHVRLSPCADASGDPRLWHEARVAAPLSRTIGALVSLFQRYSLARCRKCTYNSGMTALYLHFHLASVRALGAGRKGASLLETGRFRFRAPGRRAVVSGKS